MLIAILVIALLVVYYLLATDYLKQNRENKALAAQIGEMTESLARIPPSPADLEQRLEAARNDFAVTRGSFPDRRNTTPVVNAVLRLAEATGVKAIPLVTQSWITENHAGQDYAVFRLDVSVTGTFTRLVDFINRLETGEIQTLVIESLAVERVFDEPAAPGNLPVEASLAIAIYARPPATDEEVKPD